MICFRIFFIILFLGPNPETSACLLLGLLPKSMHAYTHTTGPHIHSHSERATERKNKRISLVMQLSSLKSFDELMCETFVVNCFFRQKGLFCILFSLFFTETSYGTWECNNGFLTFHEHGNLTHSRKSFFMNIKIVLIPPFFEITFWN